MKRLAKFPLVYYTYLILLSYFHDKSSIKILRLNDFFELLFPYEGFHVT